MSLDQNIGNQDPTAGESAGADEGTQAQTPAERSYSQRDFDGHMASARRSWEAQSVREREAAVAAIRDEYERRSQTPAQPEGRIFEDPAVEAALERFFQSKFAPMLQPLQEGQIKAETNLGIADFQSRHPELSADEMNNVLQTAVTFGEQLGPEVVNKAPINWLLDQAYLAFKFGAFDEKKFSQKAVDDYIAKKTRTATSTPRPQGSGGAVTGQRRAKDFKTADQIFEQMIARDNENG